MTITKAPPQLASKLKLLSVGNAKTPKGQKLGYATGILYLAPHTISGNNVCPASTPDCRATCLFTAGRGAFGPVFKARVRKTRAFFEDRPAFIRQLTTDINQLFYNGLKYGYEISVRLNGTSDIRWELHGVPQACPDITFYDYTKIANRRDLPPNYHLTYSFSGQNLPACKIALANGMSVAVPFLKPPPSVWLGHKVVSGDDHDLRFINPEPVIYALKAKGALRKTPNSTFLGENHAV